MDPSSLTPLAWILVITVAVTVGVAKAGMPGLSIFAVALLTSAFDAVQAQALLLPLLNVADVCAVTMYRRHAQWDRLWGLFPWVAAGVIVGGLALVGLNQYAPSGPARLLIKPMVGVILLAMLILFFVRQRWGDRLVPHRTVAVAGTGVTAGIVTTVANAAGPLMSLYLAGKGLSKEQFLGTMGWFFLLLNLGKIPVYAVIGWHDAVHPMFTHGTLAIDLILVPAVVLGALIGRLMAKRLSAGVFFVTVIVLTILATVQLLVAPWLGS